MATTAGPDPIDQIPPPEAVRQMLAESIRRTELLRFLLRVSRRKAANDSPRSTADATVRGPTAATTK